MPETAFTIRWPDGAEEACYSPSSVVHDHFTPGATYPLTEFLSRAERALNAASDRVEQKYGFACSRAMGQLRRIQARAADFDDQQHATVECIDVS